MGYRQVGYLEQCWYIVKYQLKILTKKGFAMKLFKKRAKPAPAAPAVKAVGITESDWCKIYNALTRERNAAKMRQKDPDAAPSSYMKGLDFALNTLDAHRPYDILKEVQ